MGRNASGGHKEVMAMAKFKLFKDTRGNYRWRLVASNGVKIASSGESFASLSNARRAAESVRDSAGGASIDD
jgi:uncharacterized protein YegP (UPF0339 family)